MNTDTIELLIRIADVTGVVANAVLGGLLIGLIEVMKSFHEVNAGIGGSNIRFLVDDGDAVMAGQVLAEVEA